MSGPSYTYTLTNGTTASASEVMQNFNDILNGVSDGTKDLSVAAFTASGTATFNGGVTLGNATADDITVTGSLASTIPIKTTNSYDIGSTTLGLRALFFGANSQTVKIQGSSSLAATYTLTLPVNVPAADGYVVRSTTAGVLSFGPPAPSGSNGSDADTVLTLSSTRTQVITPTANRTYTLPTTSVLAGDTWTFVNDAAIASTVLTVFINSSGGNRILTLLPQSSYSVMALRDTPTTAAHWRVIGSVKSNWFAYTPTSFSTGFGTVTSMVFEWRRDGNEMEIRGNFRAGTLTGDPGHFFTLPIIPATMSVDTNRLNGENANMLGMYHNKNAINSDAYLANAAGVLSYDSTKGATYLGLSRGNNGGNLYGPNAAVNTTTNNNDYLDVVAKYPVSGWTVNGG